MICIGFHANIFENTVLEILGNLSYSCNWIFQFANLKIEPSMKFLIALGIQWISVFFMWSAHFYHKPEFAETGLINIDTQHTQTQHSDTCNIYITFGLILLIDKHTTRESYCIFSLRMLSWNGELSDFDLMCNQIFKFFGKL